MEVLGREIEVAGAECLDHPCDLVHPRPAARHAPAPPVHDPLCPVRLIGIAQPAKVPLAHPQQLRRLHAAQLPRLMQPNRIDDPGHSDLRQHAIPPVNTRTDRVLPNPDISRVIDSLSARILHRAQKERDSGGDVMGVQVFDEMNGKADGGAAAPIRAAYVRLKRWLDEAPSDLIDARRSQAELLFRRIGITFAVYGDDEASERLIPFCIIPRVLTKPEWTTIERGLEQRVSAINAFLSDIYGAQECIKAGVIPADLVYRNPQYRHEMIGYRVPHNVYVH